MVGPIVSQSLSDVFCDNEYGPNFLFRNNGDGTFTDVAQQSGERNKQFNTSQRCRSIHMNLCMSVLSYLCRCGGPHAARQRRCSGRLQP